MARILTCDMNDLPPEIRQQIMEEQQRQDGADDARQAAERTVEQAARSGGKPKRNALKRRQKSASPPEKELVSMNVRLSRGAYDAVQTLADEYGVSKAAIIRLALSGNMSDQLGTIRYTSPEAEAAIQDGIARIFNASAEIGRQLRRIGKNYNDALRLANSMAKRGDPDAAAPDMDPDAIARLIDRYEAAAERIGEALWLIQK